MSRIFKTYNKYDIYIILLLSSLCGGNIGGAFLAPRIITLLLLPKVVRLGLVDTITKPYVKFFRYFLFYCLLSLIWTYDRGEGVKGIIYLCVHSFYFIELVIFSKYAGTEVKLDGVTTIGRTAFKDCTSLQEIVLPATVESVGYMAFRGCKKLVALTVAYIGGTATDTNEFGYIFGSNKDVPTSLTQVTVLTADKVYANAFAGAGAIQEIVLPTTVTAIEQNAFARCVSLSLVRFGENTNVNDFTQTTIGAKAFGNCGTDLYGNMYIFYNFDLTGEAWDEAWHEGANLGVTEDGEANKNLLELTDLNSDGKVDYEDYKLAKASAI